MYAYSTNRNWSSNLPIDIYQLMGMDFFPHAPLWLRMRKKRQKPLKNKNAQIFMKLHNLNVENLCIKKI